MLLFDCAGSRINCVVSITSSNRDKRQRWRSKESTGDICEVKAGTGLRNRDCCSWPCSSPEGIANHKLLEVARRAGSDRSLLPVVCCSPTVTNVQRLQDSGRHSEFIHPIHECKGDLSVENASLIRLKLKKFSIDDSKTSDKCNLSISDQFKGQHRCVSNETHNVIDSVLCTPVCKSYGSVSIDNATASTDQVLPGNDVLCHKNSELDQSVTLSRSNERRVDKFVPVFNNGHDVHVGKRSSIKSPIQSRWPATVIDSAKVVEETLVVDHVLSSNSVEIAESMHFKKQLLFAGGTTPCSFSETHPPDSVLSTGIDVNRSVTDQLTRLAKAEGIVIDRYEGKTTPDGHIDTCAASMSTNGLASLSQAQCTSISHGFTMDKRRDKGACMYGQGFHQPSPFTHHNEGRTHSCSSDSSKLSANLTDERSFASRLDNVVSIVKSSSSASTSPLILGGSEPISIYRDPELMSKNPVQSNLCASQHKSISGISFPHASHLITTQPSCYIPFSSKASKVIPGIVTHALPMMPYEANTIAAGSQLENHLQHQLTVLHPHYQQFPLQYPVHANVRHLASHVDLVYQQKLQNASVPQSSWIVGGRHDGLLPERLGHEEQLSMYERLKDDHRHSMNLNERYATCILQHIPLFNAQCMLHVFYNTFLSSMLSVCYMYSTTHSSLQFSVFTTCILQHIPLFNAQCLLHVFYNTFLSSMLSVCYMYSTTHSSLQCSVLLHVLYNTFLSSMLSVCYMYYTTHSSLQGSVNATCILQHIPLFYAQCMLHVLYNTFLSSMLSVCYMYSTTHSSLQCSVFATCILQHIPLFNVQCLLHVLYNTFLSSMLSVYYMYYTTHSSLQCSVFTTCILQHIPLFNAQCLLHVFYNTFLSSMLSVCYMYSTTHSSLQCSVYATCILQHIPLFNAQCLLHVLYNTFLSSMLSVCYMYYTTHSSLQCSVFTTCILQHIPLFNAQCLLHVFYNTFLSSMLSVCYMYSTTHSFLQCSVYATCNLQHIPLFNAQCLLHVFYNTFRLWEIRHYGSINNPNM